MTDDIVEKYSRKKNVFWKKIKFAKELKTVMWILRLSYFSRYGYIDSIMDELKRLKMKFLRSEEEFTHRLSRNRLSLELNKSMMNFKLKKFSRMLITSK